MDVTILYIKDSGDKNHERIILKAINDCNIGKYILFDTTYKEDQISNKLRHCYWFPDKEIKSGDKIILYTKKGHESSKQNKSGIESHFFYWDLDNTTIWNKKEDCAVVIKVESYITKTNKLD